MYIFRIAEVDYHFESLGVERAHMSCHLLDASYDTRAHLHVRAAQNMTSLPAFFLRILERPAQGIPKLQPYVSSRLCLWKNRKPYAGRRAESQGCI